MTTSVSYEIWLRSNTGQHLKVIDDKILLSLTVGRSIYGEGTVELTTTNGYPFDLLQQDGQLMIYRNIETLPTITGVTTAGSVISQLLTDTVFLNTYFDQRIVQSSSPFYYIIGEPFVALLKRRDVENDAASPQADKTAAGDDMMKAIMREQYGALATDATRDLSAYLTIAADVSAGVSMSKKFARRNVFQVFQEICQTQADAGTRMYFDVTYDPVANMPTFRTYTGQRGKDRSRTSSSPVLFSAERNNLAEPKLIYDFRNEINVVYALGQGVESERQQAVEMDAVRVAASPYNRRESSYDARSYTGPGLSDEAKSQVWAGRPIRSITGTLLDTSDTMYGRDWNLGDLVTAEFGAIQQDCIVESVTISRANGVDTVHGVARGIN